MITRLRRRFVPLRVRLPLSVAALIALCTGGVIVVSYRAVRLSTATAEIDRLHTAAERIAVTLGQQMRRATIDAQRIGERPAVVAWLATGTGADANAVRASLDSVLRSAPANAALAIRRRAGGELVIGDSAALSAARASWHGAGVGPFFAVSRRVGMSARTPLVARGDTIGELQLVSLLSTSAENIALIGALVGRQASFSVGNADGSLWTNLAQRMPPLANAAAIHEMLTARRPAVSRDTLAAAAAVAGTPWVVWVGQPAATALAAATSVMWELTLLAILVSIAGGLVAWMVIRHVTEPLDELAHASEMLARGEYGPRMGYAAGDEIGRLTASFNDMAEQIERHRQELEDQVAERTIALEKALLDLQIAQEANVKRERLAVLGQLAGGVGHELRNPLGVMTNALFVLDTVLTERTDMVREYLGILRGQIALSEKIISDLLDFARTKPAARLPTTPEAIVRAQVARLDPPKHVTIEFDMPASVPPVHVDPVQIGQVVFNLVMNGVQAMSEHGGVLRCRTRADGDHFVRVEVADAGPGMPPDVAKRVFEPLFTTKARGLGLGLTVSRMLAENNGGQLTFESAIGVGTTFTLTLPTFA